MRRACILIFVAACPAGGDDDHDDDSGVDDTAGLTVRWNSRPENLPGSAGSSIELASAVFRGHNLRVVGDAGPGDPRTFREDVTLEWADEISPAAEEFSEAPAGLYSRIVLELDGDEDYAYEIAGMVDLNGSPVPFTIRDRDALPISIDCSLTLAPGGEASVTVLVDLEQIVDGIDFDALPVQDGRRVLETGDAQLQATRDEIGDAFSVQ